MNGTVNPLYGGNNMNGGTSPILNEQIQSSLNNTAVNSPLQALAQNTAANFYKNAPDADYVGKVITDVTKDIKKTSNITSDKISSIIFTVMQALSNSFTGGMNGMKAELDKISSEQEGGDDNAMVSFLADCGNFLNFFIQYSTINKQLQYKITHPDDDDLLAPEQKAYIRGIKKKLDGETTFPVSGSLVPKYDDATGLSSNNLREEIETPTLYLYRFKDKKSQWIKYEESSTDDVSPSEIFNQREMIALNQILAQQPQRQEPPEQIQTKIQELTDKQRKQYLKKLNNIELEFYQEKLNNAFQYLTYTYGQLSGRTLYNLTQLLASGQPPDVGLFAPLSMGSLAGTAIRMYPGVGPALDTINNFISAFKSAFKMSYKTLKQERILASEYISETTKESNDTLRKLQTGGTTKEPVKYIDKATFIEITGKNKKDSSDKDFQTRAKAINGASGHIPLSNDAEFSKAKAEGDIKMLNKILYDYNRLMSLKKLFKAIVGSVESGNLKTQPKYYHAQDTKDNKKDTFKKINKKEADALKRAMGKDGNELKTGFDELIELLEGLEINDIETKDPTINNTNEKKKSPIETNNPVLYDIVKQFIKTTYNDLTVSTTPENSDDQQKSNEPTNSNIEKGLEDLIELIDGKKTEIHKFLKLGDDKNKQLKAEKDTDTDENRARLDVINKFTKDIKEEETRINNMPPRGQATNKGAIHKIITDHIATVNKNITSYRDKELDRIGNDIVASHSFKPLKKLISKYLNTLKTKFEEMITVFKSNGLKTDGKDEADAKKNEADDKLIRTALPKILNFIIIEDIEASNKNAEIINKNVATLKEKMNSGGSMRRSTIKRRIKKATRRIQLSLDGFNSGHNTRRGRYRKKRHKTRRMNYGH